MLAPLMTKLVRDVDSTHPLASHKTDFCDLASGLELFSGSFASRPFNCLVIKSFPFILVGMMSTQTPHVGFGFRVSTNVGPHFQ